MKKTLRIMKIISATWLCRLFFRLGEYFFDLDQAARIDEWVEKNHGADPVDMGWPLAEREG